MMPANSGVASLVPQVGYQPAGWPRKLWYITTAPLQEALIEMSGTPRCGPVTDFTASWYAGRPKNTDRPPPAASGLGCAEPVKVRWVARLNVSFHTESGPSRWPLGPSR